MSSGRFTSVVFFIAAFGNSSLAESRLVPSVDYPTLQSCIDAAVDGDECVVAPGTYNEAIDFLGKAVWLRSESGPEVTILEGTGLGKSVVTCNTGEGPGTVFQGFTVANGTGTLINEEYLGGGMYIKGSSPSIIDCHFVGNAAAAGGGLYNDINSNSSVSGCTFRDNHATIRGGGIYSRAIISVEDCDFLRNTSEIDAGAIRNYEGDLFVRRCTFRENHAVQVGGAIASLNYYVLIEDSHFAENSATDGGAMWREDWYVPGAQPVRRTTFVANTAAQGGAVAGSGVVVQFESCTFEMNTAEETGGGLFWFGHDAPPKLFDCHFLRNRAGIGGAIRLDQYAHAQIVHTTFYGNIAEAKGGAIATSYGSTPVAINTVFSGNRAVLGGAVFSEYSGPVGLLNCALAGNVAAQEGGAVFGAVGTFNSIVWGNQAPTSEQMHSIPSGSGAHFRHSNIQGSGGSLEWNETLGEDEGGNMDAEPKFVRMPEPGSDGKWGTDDDDYGDVHLLPDSPCTDMGDDGIADFLDFAFYYHSDLVITTDFDGEERTQSCSIDIGPDEAAFLGVDCNGNEANDACDVVDDLELDCNNNRVPDHCEVADGRRPDCNVNGIPDECDIADDPSRDCNLNELPDECEPLIDCNGNLLRDDCETRDGTTKDCNDNFVPDTCESDAFPSVLYVDDDAPEGGDGLSWNTAFRNLQHALSWSDCDLVQEIRIAGGTYTPGSSSIHTFQLGGQSNLIGGFAGRSGLDADARDIVKYETILSGNGGLPNSNYDDSTNVVTVIKVEGEPILDGLTITRGNARTDSNSFGGGIYSSYTNLTLRRCKFIDNSAKGGGGALYIDGPGTVRIEDCTFINNTAPGYFGGAGVRVAGSSQLTVVNSVFENNYASTGGALKAEAALIVVEQCQFRYNEVSSYSGGGGAIATSSGTLLVSDSTFENNEAELGGAIRVAASALAHIQRCDFRSNWVRNSGNGGGLAVSGIASVQHCAFEDNTAGWSGGAITNDAGVTEIRDCDFLRNAAGAGGAISNRNAAQPLIVDCLLAENVAQSGGAIYNAETSAATILRCNLERNAATGQTSTTGRGGAIYNVDESAPLIADSRIAQNTAIRGGGMYNDESSAPMLLRTDVLLNHAATSAGISGRGGGTHCAASTRMIARQTQFVRNQAEFGGGVYNESALTEIRSSSLLGNTAAVSGGGIINLAATIAQLSDSVIVGNRASNGGGLYNFGSPRVTNCTFAKNSGHAVYNWSGTSQFFNSIVWQNWTGDVHVVSSFPFFNYSSSRTILHYCNARTAGIMGMVRGLDSIDAEPLVVRIPQGGADGFGDNLFTTDIDESANDDYGDLRLLPVSPGVDQGDPAFAAAAGQADRDGHSRVLCGRVDIGAYERGISDFNCDDVLTVEDFAAWTVCLAGPNNDSSAGCQAFDFDADGDVDLHDTAGFFIGFLDP